MTKPTLRAWIPVLFWLALVAWESTWLFASNETSRLLRPLLTFLFGHLTDARFDLLHALLRKCGHFFLYAVLSLLSFRAWWTTLHSETEGHSWRHMLSRWSLAPAALSVAIAVAVAAFDEFHQAFVSSRTGNIRDVVLDTLGAVFVQLVLLICSSGVEIRTARARSALANARVQRQQHQG